MLPLLRTLAGGLVVAVLAVAGGCGSRNPAAVSGKVTFNGQPVTAGELTFSPFAEGGAADGRRPSTASIQPDGTFVVATDLASGASLGRHVVRFAPVIDWEPPPDWNGQGPPPQPPKGPYDGLTPKAAEVDIQPGGNELVIELVPAAQARLPPLAGQ